MTVSTQHVLQRFIAEAGAWDQTQGEAAEEFQVWLASVKADAYRTGYNRATSDIVDEDRSRKAKAEAFDEGAQNVYQDNELVGGIWPVNPYRGGTE